MADELPPHQRKSLAEQPKRPQLQREHTACDKIRRERSDGHEQAMRDALVPQTLRYYPAALGADRVSAPTSRRVRDGARPFVSKRTRVLA